MSGGVSADDREKAIKAIGRRMTWPSLHWRDLVHTDAHAAIVDLLIDEGWGPGGAPARPTRDDLADVVQRGLWENHRGKLTEIEWAIVKDQAGPTVGQSRAEARGVVDALLAAGHLWAEQPTAGVPVDQVLAYFDRHIAWIITAHCEDHVRRNREFRGILEGLLPSVAVVNREAVATEVRVAVDRFYQQTVAEITQSVPLHEFVVSALISSGVIRDTAAMRSGIVHVTTAPDMETRAELFNDGYEAAVAQGLADDPTLAGDWLAERDERIRAEQREKDAQIIHDWLWEDGDDSVSSVAANAAAAIRAGGTQ